MTRLYELLAMLLPALALGGLLGRLWVGKRIKDADDKAYRAESAQMESEARLRGARATDGLSDTDLVRRVAKTGRARSDSDAPAGGDKKSR